MKYLISTMIAVMLALLPCAGRSFVVIPVEFSDVEFQNKGANVDAKVSLAEEYFRKQFGDSFRFDIFPTVRLSREIHYYGANTTQRHDDRIDQAVREACRLCGRSLQPYDNDGDNVVDNVMLIVAGPDESDGAGVEYIWPQQDYLSARGGVLLLNGLTIDSFCTCTEFSKLSKLCHEFAHTLGLQDMYDTDGNGSGGTSKGLWGSLSLMDSNTGPDSGTPPNFNAIELEQLGLGNPLPFRLGYNTIRPISSSKDYLRINTDTEDEYFLLECRDNEGWDSVAGGRGLIIYHVDRSANTSWYSDFYGHNLTAAERWSLNQVNCRPDHQCARVIEALPGTSDRSKIFFPQEGRKTFGSETDPPFRYWNGNTSDYALDAITLNGDGSVSFNLIIPVRIELYQVFQDAAIIRWHLDSSCGSRECTISWYPDGQRSSSRSAQVGMQNDGTFYYILENLKPSTNYQLSITATNPNGVKYSKSLSFTTKSRQSTSYPFIYLSTMTRNPDGSFPSGSAFPMRIYNAGDVKRVDWYYNGRYIEPFTDGYWHFYISGELKAVIWYEDGSSEIISKTITVR